VTFTVPPRAAALPDIERELARLLRSVGEAQAADAPPVMRALVANLVACAPTPEAAAEAAEILPQVIRRHPCRAILLSVRSEAPVGQPQAEVGLVCQEAGEANLCCEYIALSANAADEDLLAGAALPLLLADLPTFVWWLGDPPFGSTQFERLAEAADRLVVDSAGFANPLSALAELSMHAAVHQHRAPMCDLNWARLTPWRSLAASLFDPPDSRPLLNGLSVLELELGRPAPAEPVNPAAAFMFLGWLAGCLGWTLDKQPVKFQDGALAIRFRSGERPVAARIVLTPEAPSGRLRSVRLEAGHDGTPALFQVSRDYSHPRAVTRAAIGEAEPRVRVAHYEHRGRAELLAEDMQRLAGDEAYEAALGMAEAIRGLLKMEMYLPV
jgi:glucose-6-phosphate dehydrogenase assembly protein OpcA